jgi:hypothetical protein
MYKQVQTSEVEGLDAGLTRCAVERLQKLRRDQTKNRRLTEFTIMRVECFNLRGLGLDELRVS